jgi:SAM-dependent methyltransferase
LVTAALLQYGGWNARTPQTIINQSLVLSGLTDDQMNTHPAITSEEWEWMWAAYDAPTYQLVLNQITSDDIVLEIGAGDLRLSRQIAERAEWVYALEQNHSLLERSSRQLPANLEIIAGDARDLPFPGNVTTAVLLMRHCTHFSLYFAKLQAIFCQRLITNTRWGMNVETIQMNRPRRPYRSLKIGWYACCCGNCGFKPGPPQAITEAIANQVWEVDSCPVCKASSNFNKKAFKSTKSLSW